MKKSKLAILALAAATLVFAMLYLNTRDTMEFNERRDAARLLNYEADEYCFRLATTFCIGPEQASMLQEGTDTAQPPSFDGVRSIAGIYLTNYTDRQPPLYFYYVNYHVYTPDRDLRLIRQTVLLKKTDNIWTFEILDYKDEGILQ